MRRIPIICSFLITFVFFSFNVVQAEEKMVLVRGGCFQMGVAFGERNAQPMHEICVNDYYMDAYEVTQREFKEVMETNPSYWIGDALPVHDVQWKYARRYCETQGKRLPTEAEWEYAAKSGGQNMIWSGTNNMTEVQEYAWFKDNSNGKYQPVGKKKPNQLGIYDMTGNAWEWVHDIYSRYYYKNSPKDNPKGPEAWKEDQAHVYRGGSFREALKTIQTTYRDGKLAGTPYIGFRCAKDVTVP